LAGRIERNHRRNRYKRIVLFGETFIASVQIEEAKLSHANLPRSEHENLESDLRGGGKRLFFEVHNVTGMSQGTSAAAKPVEQAYQAIPLQKKGL
jgi:hypothetical protein